MKTYGLIGFPLIHSFSEKYFFEKFRIEKIKDCEYKLFQVQNIKELTELIKDNPSIEGLNVTIPYKQTVIPYLDELDEVASKIKAVNTIKIFRGEKKIKLKGFNTDAWGFKQSLELLLQPLHTHALILGTGGAAKSVRYVLSQLGTRFIFVSRSPRNILSISYDGVTEKTIQQHKLIINTTPLGMFPDIESFPAIDYESITPNHLLFDLIYNPAETLFLKKGKEKGAQIKNGLEMLHLQADKAWEIWQDRL